MAKYDWNSLKGEYIRGEYKTLQEFLDEKGIKRSAGVIRKTTGWVDEKKAYDEAVQEQTNETTKKALAESEAQIRVRQQKAAKFLQYKALNALQGQVPEDAMQSLKMLQVGLSQEREALDLNKKPLIAGEINIAVMHTRYGKMLQELDYDELKDVLERLAELDGGGKAIAKTGDASSDGVVEGEVVSD